MGRKTRRIVALTCVAALVVVSSLLAATRASKAAPTAARGALTQSALPTGKWCSGVRIRFFAGGAPGDAAAQIYTNGAKMAAAALGPRVAFVYSGWSPEKMLSQFRDAVAAKPEGIVMLGHPGTQALLPVAKEAQAKGILVNFYDTDVPEVRAKYGGGFIGINSGTVGTALGEEAVKLFSLKKGQQAIVFGAFSQPITRRIREENAARALEAAGLKVVRLDTPAAAATDPNLLTPIVTAAILRHPTTKIIVYPGGQNLGGAPLYMKAAHKKPGQIYNAGFDVTPGVIEGFQNGYIQLTANAQLFLGGYLSIQGLCLEKKFGFAPLNINTGAGFVTAKNYKSIAHFVALGIQG